METSYMLNHFIRTALTLCLITVSTAHAETAIEIDNAWVRTAPPTVKVMAGYMKISNHSQKTITLLSVNSPQFSKVEIHRSIMHSGMMHMEKVEPFSLKGHQELILEPGGYHLMLIKPVHSVGKGEQVHFNFSFDNGDKLSLMAEVKDGEEQMEHGGDHRHH